MVAEVNQSQISNTEKLISEVVSSQLIAKLGLPNTLYSTVISSCLEITNYIHSHISLQTLQNFSEHPLSLNAIDYKYLFVTVSLLLFLYQLKGADINFLSYLQLSQLYQADSLIIDTTEGCTTIIKHLSDREYFLSSYSKCANVLSYEYSEYLMSKYPQYGIYVNRLPIPMFNYRYYFRDTGYGVEGYIIWRKISKTEKFEKKTLTGVGTNETSTATGTEDFTVNVPYLEIHVYHKFPLLCSRKRNAPAENYYKHIRDIKNSIRNYRPKFIDRTDRNNEISCTIDVIYDPIKQSELYREDLNIRKRDFIDTFFHPQKERLWKYLSTIHFNPTDITRLGQYPQLSLCLYGPPGTGKSTFAYRVARALGRHIVKLDLRTIPNKLLLEQHLMSSIRDTTTKNTVFVFDEFDIGIRYLVARSQKKKYYNRITERILHGKIEQYSQLDSDGEEKPKRKRKKKRKRRETSSSSSEK